jgi:23S rRNA pseudouridine1911/1915/1917 synthase
MEAEKTDKINEIAPDESDLDTVEEDGAEHVQLVIRRLLPMRRIDKYLAHRFPDFSRNMIQGLIQEQAVTVNGGAVKPSYQLRPGDKVDVILPPLPSNEIQPEPIPLEILYEDEHMLVVNKQPDLIVHPARGNRGGTLVNALAYYSESLSTVNGAFRPGVVHRLDRNTTGVIVVAKTDTAHWRLAVVHGTLDLDADVIDMPLGRHPHVREKYAAMPDTGKHARTRYELQRQYRGYALVKVKPETGRTHQIRVHMALLKHPVVADTMYGGKMMTLEQLAQGQPLPGPGECGSELNPDEPVLARQALHAYQLEIRHPESGELMQLEAPLPQDMKRLLELLERYRS